MWRLGWWSLLLLLLQGQWHGSLNMTCLRLQVFGQMTWDIKRVFPYYKRTHVLKDLKTPTPRKTDTSPETTHHRYRKVSRAQHLNGWSWRNEYCYHAALKYRLPEKVENTTENHKKCRRGQKASTHPERKNSTAQNVRSKGLAREQAHNYV